MGRGPDGGDVHPGFLRPTEAVVDLDACVHNLRVLRARVGARGVWPVVKADGYGHSAVPVTRVLAGAGAAGFCVATVAEGVELRRAGIGQPILVMGGVSASAEGLFAPGGSDPVPSADDPGASTVDPASSTADPVSSAADPGPSTAAPGSSAADPDPFDLAVTYGLRVAVWDLDTGRRMAEAARRSGSGPAPLHLKVDTGMGRLGVLPDKVPELAGRLAELDGVRLDGVFSNLATADELDGEGRDHCSEQIERFAALCRELLDAGRLPAQRHLANSAALMHHPAAWDADWCTAVRPGLAIYGASLTPGHDPVELRPALSLRTAIAAVRDVPEGWRIGYGGTYRTARPSRLAVLPVGYHDGLPRRLSNRAEVLVRGRRAPIVGRISMDLTLIDITDVADARPGDPVILIGSAADDPGAATPTGHVAAPEDRAARPVGGEPAASIPVEEVAAWAGTIPHEVLSRIGGRVPRRHVTGAPPEPTEGA